MVIGLRKIVGFAVALVCAVATSQAPEFAQQYRQRLGGALQELAEVITVFDADAATGDLRRGEALAVMERSESVFLRDRGRSMRATINRFEDLTRQAGDFAAAPAVLRPVVVLRGADAALLRGTAGDFEPAVPVTPHGLIWTAIGFVLGLLLAKVFGRLLWRRRVPPVRNLRVSN